MQAWMKEHNVLSIVLRDNLHQPQVNTVAFNQVLFITNLLSQYVEKLEKILRFCIKEHSLSVEDLDAIWACQVSNIPSLMKIVMSCTFACISTWVHIHDSIWPNCMITFACKHLHCMFAVASMQLGTACNLQMLVLFF